MKRSKFPTSRSWRSFVRAKPDGRWPTWFVPTASPSRPINRWKAKYGGMELSEMQRLKQLEDENRRLKQIVAEQTLDIQALKAVVAKKW